MVVHPKTEPARVLWKFSRPHAFLGTLTSIVALDAMAVGLGDAERVAVGRLAWTLLSCLSAAVFIVGINQYFDVAIDRINKPHLPIAAGELSGGSSRLLLGVLVILAFATASVGGPYLLGTVAVSTVVGVAYSCPPLRLKRSPVAAAACIVLVRGLVINGGLYLHFAETRGIPDGLPPTVWLLCGFTATVAGCIALCKDIPDVEGDARFDQRTLAQAIGRRGVFRVCLGTLVAAIVAVGLLGASGLTDADPATMAASQSAILVAVVLRARGVDPDDRASIKRFYMFVWIVFLAEYLAFAAACLAGRSS